MKPLLLAAIVAMAASGPAWAQSSTATGTGVGIAKSTSGSQAISGQGGSATITTNSSVPADQTVKNVPSVFAPGLAAAGLETCLGSVSGGGAIVGTGFSFGTSIPDPACAARLDARTLWSMGLKKAAVARLCLNGDIYRAMPDVCAIYLPRAPVAPIYAPAIRSPMHRRQRRPKGSSPTRRARFCWSRAIPARSVFATTTTSPASAAAFGPTSLTIRRRRSRRQRVVGEPEASQRWSVARKRMMSPAYYKKQACFAANFSLPLSQPKSGLTSAPC